MRSVHFCVMRVRIDKNKFGGLIYLVIFAPKFNKINLFSYENNYRKTV